MSVWFKSVMGVLLCCIPSVFAVQPPNIVLIMADDMGYETLAVNGADEYKTPVLDQLSAEGVRFENCFASPLCTPSRVKLMTGKYNVRNYVGFGRLDRDERSFGKIFQEAGYATAIAGKWQLGKEPDAPQHFGFDQALLWQHTRPRTKEGTKFDSRYSQPWLELNGVATNYGEGFYGPDVLTDFLCDFIETNKDGPFLAYYPMVLTHCPFTPTPDSDDWDPTSPGSATYGGDKKYFADMVKYTDKLIGKLVDCLETNNLMDNTLVLFIGDNGTYGVSTLWNGEMIHGGKFKVIDEGTRVPFVAYSPSLIQSNVVTDAIVDLADFLPTLCDMAGISIPEANEPIDGVSFWDTLRGIPGRDKPWAYLWYPGGSTVQVQARTKTHVLTRSGFDAPYVFEDSSDRYHPVPLDIGSLAGDDLNTYEMLLDVIELYDNGGTPPRDIGFFEAESYDVKQGFSEVNAHSASGGITMGMAKAGSILKYNVNVTNAGTYTVAFRIAASANTIQFDLKNDTSVLCAVDSPATGNWTTFKTVTNSISLTEGVHHMTIESKIKKWSIDWLEFTRTGD